MIDFLEQNNNGRYFRYTSRGAVFAEQYKRRVRNLLKKLVIEKGNANWITEVPLINKKN